MVAPALPFDPGMALPEPFPVDANLPPDGLFGPPPLETPRQDRMRSRVKEFTLPDPPKRPKPSLKTLVQWKNERVNHWSLRNERMKRHEQLYLMQDPAYKKGSGRSGEEAIRRNYARALIDKLSYMVGRQRARIATHPRTQSPDHIGAAQNCEDFLYDVWEHAQDKHVSKLNQSLPRDEAWFGACRGWLISRVYLDYDDLEQPVCFEVRDPLCCYPRPGKVGIGYLRDMIVFEETNVVTFLGQNPKYIGHAYFNEKEDKDPITYLWYEDDVHSILIVDDAVELDADEHNYGFCPWIVDLQGGPASRLEEARDQIGAGALMGLEHIMAYQDRFYSQLATGIARQGNPATVDYIDRASGKVPAKIAIAPGSRNTRYTDERVEVLKVEERMDQVQVLAGMIESDLARAGLPDVLWGDPSGLSNGFHQAVSTFAAEDALFPIASMITSHRERRNKLALALVLVAERKGILNAEWSDDMADDASPTPGIVFRKPNRTPTRQRKTRYIYSVLRPEDVKLHGLGNEVRLRRMTPTDLLQMGQFAAMMATSGLLSMAHVRGEFLDVDDPVAMNNESLYDQLYKDPDILKQVLIPRMLEQLDPALAAWLEMQAQQAPPQQQGPPPQQGPPGMPPPGLGGITPGAPPPAMPGFDNAMLPSDMQAVGGPGFPGDPQALLALLAGQMQPPQPGALPF